MQISCKFRRVLSVESNWPGIKCNWRPILNLNLIEINGNYLFVRFPDVPRGCRP